MTPYQLFDVYEQAERHWKKNLRDEGIEFPNLDARGKLGISALALVYLYDAFTQKRPLVSKEDLTRFIHGFRPDAAPDTAQAARHLKYAGFDVRCSGKSGDSLNDRPVPDGHYALENFERPSRYFFDNKARRVRRVAATDWDSLKALYGNACGMCHSTGLPLEKGHKDPHGSDGIENLIPVCSACNNWASDDVVVDGDGRVCALASTKLVDASSDAVKVLIYRKLKRDFK